MIGAVIHNQKNTLVIDFPRGMNDLQLKLMSVGINRMPQEIPITNHEEDDIRVELFSESDTGNHLIRLFQSTDSLVDVNNIEIMIMNTDDAVKTELEQNIIHEQYGSVKELLEDIETMNLKAGKFTESFYYPLTVMMDDEETGTLYQENNAILMDYASEINRAVEEEQSRDTHNMAEYFHGDESVKNKMVSAEWTVEEINGELYGCVHVRLKENLTEEEKNNLKDWIIGQNADGFGESFEQHPLETEDGDLYISFWNAGKDYFIYDRNEMNMYILQQSGPQMGGM